MSFLLNHNKRVVRFLSLLILLLVLMEQVVLTQSEIESIADFILNISEAVWIAFNLRLSYD